MIKKGLILIVLISFLVIFVSGENSTAMQINGGIKFYNFMPLHSRSFVGYGSLEGEMLGLGAGLAVQNREQKIGLRPGMYITNYTRYEISGKYYFQTADPFKPYIGSSLFSSNYTQKHVEDGEVTNSNSYRGVAASPFIGIDLKSNELGLPYTTLFGGLNYILPLSESNEDYFGGQPTADTGLTFHLGFKINLSGLLF